MDILGIGPLELVLVLIVALMVFGPDRLPQIGSKLGRTMKSMRRATRDFSREIDQTRAAIMDPTKEVTQPLQEAGDLVKGMATAAQAFRNPGEALRQSVIRELKATEPTAAVPEATATVSPAAEPNAPENRIAPPGLSMEAASPGAEPGAPAPAADVPPAPQTPPSGEA